MLNDKLTIDKSLSNFIFNFSLLIYSRFVITSDRDEKVRITRFPKTHVIETYCLGHTEYVSSIELLPSTTNPTLISVSGDKTLRLWNYINGKELACVDLPEPGFKLALSQTSHLAVLLLATPLAIAFYNLTKGQDLKVSSLGHQTFGAEIKHVSSILYDENNDVVVSCVNDSDKVLFKRFKYEGVNNQYVETSADDINDLAAKLLTTNKIDIAEDVSVLFKKRFDNMASYQERKKRRIEEKKH